MHESYIGHAKRDNVPNNSPLYYIYKSTTSQRRSRHSTNTAQELNAQAPKAPVSEGLAYVAAKAGVEPLTIPKKGVVSTSAPPTPTSHLHIHLSFFFFQRVNCC